MYVIWTEVVAEINYKYSFVIDEPKTLTLYTHFTSTKPTHRKNFELKLFLITYNYLFSMSSLFISNIMNDWRVKRATS